MLWHAQAEADLFATTGSDRSVALFDLRSATPLRKIIMQVQHITRLAQCTSNSKHPVPLELCVPPACLAPRCTRC